MRKLICSLLVLTFLFTFSVPTLASGCYGKKILHNVKRLGEALGEFSEIQSTNIDNPNVKVTLALKIVKLKEVIQSGRKLKKSMQAGGFQGAYVSMLDSFDNATEDMIHGIRDEDPRQFAKAKYDFKQGFKKMQKIKNSLKR